MTCKETVCFLNDDGLKWAHFMALVAMCFWFFLIGVECLGLALYSRPIPEWMLTNAVRDLRHAMYLAVVVGAAAIGVHFQRDLGARGWSSWLAALVSGLILAAIAFGLLAANA